VYSFDISVRAGQTYDIDPAGADGFIYRIGAGDPNFASVDLPTSGRLYLWNGSSFIFAANLNAGSVYDFVPGGVSEFEIRGIPGDLDLLSGDEYITGVTFAGSGTFTGQMLSVVPESSTWAMLLVGFAGLGLFGYHKTRRPQRRSRRLTPGSIDRVLRPVRRFSRESGDEIIGNLRSLLEETQTTQGPGGEALLIKTAPNTFRVIFAAAMRIAPNIEFRDLP
jgi:hypothetical protein